MRLELRWAISEDHTERYVRAIVLVAQSSNESRMLDEVFGSKVLDADGLIDRRELPVECRLSDGYGEHYLAIDLRPVDSRAKNNPPSTTMQADKGPANRDERTSSERR